MRYLKFFIALSIISMLSLASIAFVYAEDAITLGDVNSDDSVTVRDALKVLKVAAKLDTIDEAQIKAADVNLDTAVDAEDALLIFKKIVGQIWYYPGETVEASGKIYIAGDSIASEHDPDDTYQRQVVGWGVVIGDLFDENVTILNEARSGRSSKNYLRESNYSVYINNLSKGDYYLISFGHNDEKASDLSRYTDPYGASDENESFKWYLKTYYIDPALEVGAYPVLVSSVVRCNFNGNVLAAQSHEAYAIAMEELVAEYKEQGIDVGYIDLHQMTADYYNEVGVEEAESLHAYTATELDRTHYCEKGAKIVSEMIVKSMKEQGYDICKFIPEVAE